MGVFIRSTGVSKACQHSSIANAVEAAQRCLDCTGIDLSAVDLLINIGVYRDDNIMEPSIAALIQQRLELNPDPVLNDFNARTFSFDLMNGAAGFLNAVHVAGALLDGGAYQNALIVSGDVHPSREWKAGFPFSSVGAAMLLGKTQNEYEGFGPVAARTTTENGYVGYLAQGALADFGISGREHGVFSPQDDYKLAFFECLVGAIDQFLQQAAIARDDIDVLVTSQLGAGFPQQVARALGLKRHCIVADVFEQWGDTHTSAPALCLHELMAAGRIKPGQGVLVALVGSGISTTCCFYRVPA